MVLPKLVWRYLFSGKLSTKVITFVSLLGTFIATASLLLTLGVMNGFQRAVFKSLLSHTPHVLVFLDTRNEAEELLNSLRGNSEVKKAFWYAVFNLIASRDEKVAPLTVYASDLKNLESFLDLRENLVEGNLTKDGLILGDLAADNLGLERVPDGINLINPIAEETPIGFLPEAEPVTVRAIYSTGFFVYDSAAVADYSFISKLFKPNAFNVVVQLKNPYRAQDFAKRLEELFPYAYTTTWIDRNRDFFNALNLEKLAMTLVVALITVVAAFNVFSLLVMKVRELRRDFAVFRAFGAGKGFIFSLVVLQGFLIGTLGVVFGVLLSAVSAFFANKYKLIQVPADVYLTPYIPVVITPTDYILVSLGVILLSTLAAVAPAVSAVREKVSEILRNE